ncbi:nucleotidyltransferase domain-containing protein [Lysinibacillus sp. Bpr_S20]|uniref:nucleotidyltransferase domain-containing protein n=1 Tax=Lysinibacillus sp. Bpr_S20 TaxID=2933964 RepID=UPI0020121297|nr:nucleotidyltransferase domain-containing protein [Lysinibacillus sp. Bpr_S20]MCL1700727.1 nucleotidyltransferase domain-containing protein [Lysinibacillus sp. Bpr_S20]
MNRLRECLIKQKQILESQGHTVAYISIYGSQNYNLDINNENYQSDIDMKAIIVPTLDELIYNSKPISTVIETEWGQCDLKDVRSYFQTLIKVNPAYIETLFTDYYIVDERFKKEFNEIFSLKDELVEKLSAQMIRAMYGMMCEKQKALCHPYPTIAHKIEKYGYDGKQLSHVIRLYVMMQDYYGHDKSMKEALIPSDTIGMIMKAKLNQYSLEDAKYLMDLTMKQGKEFKEEILKNIDESTIDYSVKDKFIKLSQDIIKNKIIEECRNYE